MPTIVYSNNWDSVVGGNDNANASRVTSPVYAGAGALRINTTLSVGYWSDDTPGTDPSIVVAHFYVRAATWPTEAIPHRIFHLEGATNSFELMYHQPSGQLRNAFDGVVAGSGAPVTTNTWYEIDWMVNISTSNLTVAARVGKVPIASYIDTGITAPQTFSGYKIGWNATAPTGDVYWDELTVSHTLADYPMAVDIRHNFFRLLKKGTP